MTHRSLRHSLIVGAASLALAVTSLTIAITSTAIAPDTVSAANVTTHTPVMGPNLLSASQLARWFNSQTGGTPPNVPSLHDNVTLLAQIFIDEGRSEGVRGDIAFVQSILETGWFSFANSQITPDANNFAGINAFDGRPGLANCKHGDAAPSRCFASAEIGVLTQIQLLRSYADATTTHLPHRLISAPADRVGDAPIWEYFGGTNCPCGKLIWASGTNYGIDILKLYSEALVSSGVNAACVPYAPGNNAHNAGSGYWMATDQSHVYSFGSAHYYGDPSSLQLARPLIGGAALSDGTGYWLLGRDGGVFSFGHATFHGSTGARHLNQPINGMARTVDNQGYWLVAYDGGIFTFGDAKFHGSTGNMHLNQPVLGMERTRSGNGYWLFARDGGVFTFGDARFYGSTGNLNLGAPVVSMQRTPDGRGYWMLAQNGQVFAFGDAHKFGDISGCSNYGGANRLLASPDGRGYWIATADGSVIAFGDARRLGFPVNIAGRPVALMLAR
ncbi:MAG TPA: glucosaminidase domain-containing protein [Acidimicrobiia bacterium]|nr:glucosaminidase domain-containing protein [Acidimicrobiia bacterium]